MTHQQKETKHKAVFSDHDIDYLLANADGAEPPSFTPGFFKAAITLGRDLGLRLGDICNLEWACFDMVNKVATVWTDKSNTRVQLPVGDQGVELLNRLPRQHPTYLFSNERKIASDANRRAILPTAFGRFMARFGLTGKSFHCLRSSYATVMAHQGAGLQEIAARLGHKSTDTTTAYVRTSGDGPICGEPTEGGALQSSGSDWSETG